MYISIHVKLLLFLRGKSLLGQATGWQTARMFLCSAKRKKVLNILTLWTEPDIAAWYMMLQHACLKSGTDDAHAYMRAIHTTEDRQWEESGSESNPEPRWAAFQRFKDDAVLPWDRDSLLRERLVPCRQLAALWYASGVQRKHSSDSCCSQSSDPCVKLRTTLHPC
jgi:hypothetical protein